MRIGVLTFVDRKEKIAVGTRSIIADAKARGHKVKRLYSKSVDLVFGNGKRILYKGKSIAPSDYDVILVRPGFSADPGINSSIIKQFQLAGFHVINGYIGVFRAKNKIRTLQMLDHFGIPVPKTHVIRDSSLLQATAAELKYPLIIKSIYGTHGKGVFIAESERSLKPIAEYLITKERGPIKLQEYVQEANGKDLRIFVAGKRILASMERTAKKGEFRANFHQGGNVGSVIITDAEKEIAIKATRILGLDIAGVDILRTKNGPKIIEVNSNPGIEGISKASGINVAKKVVDFLERRVEKQKQKKIPLLKKKMTE